MTCLAALNTFLRTIPTHTHIQLHAEKLQFRLVCTRLTHPDGSYRETLFTDFTELVKVKIKGGGVFEPRLCVSYLQHNAELKRLTWSMTWQQHIQTTVPCSRTHEHEVTVLLKGPVVCYDIHITPPVPANVYKSKRPSTIWAATHTSLRTFGKDWKKRDDCT